MFYILPLLLSVFAIAIPLGKLETEALDAASQFNVLQVTKILDTYYYGDGKYPKTIEELVEIGELKNMPDESTYSYSVSSDRLIATFVLDNWCWVSTGEKIIKVNFAEECHNKLWAQNW